MCPRASRELLRTALDECALTDDALCKRVSSITGEPLTLERLAAIKEGTADLTPDEILVVSFVMIQAWDATPDQYKQTVLEEYEEKPRPPREQVLQAVDNIVAAARTARRAKRKAITPYTPASELPEFLTAAECCKYLTLSRNVVYGAIKSGQLRSRQFAGKQYRIPRSALLDFARSGATLEKAGA